VSGHPALRAWLRFWRIRQRYHRYQVVGLDRLASDQAMLLVAYHGRPLAYDQCMLSVSMYDRFGYMPHGVIHSAVDDQPVLRWMKDGLGFVTGDGPEISAAVARGEHIALQPGGTREGCRSVRHRYTVDWGRRHGYLRLALRHGLPIVPVAAAGVDDCYIGLNDGYRLGRRLGAPSGLPVWFGVGVAGLWPLSPPLPVRITTHIGRPIQIDVDPDDPDAMMAAHERIKGAVQDVLDEARRAS
jgi:1-acyl-sn-glycerol-3-phosphate acyltransferase